MGVIGNPFKLFGRILVAGFLITEYTAIFFIQVLWYIIGGQKRRIIDAYAAFWKNILDTIVGIFRN